MARSAKWQAAAVKPRWAGVAVLCALVLMCGCVAEPVARVSHRKNVDTNNGTATPPSATALAKRLEEKYRIKIIRHSSADVFPKSWQQEPISAHMVEIDEKEFLRLPALLETALAKYPAALIAKNIKSIVLAKEIVFYGVGYGGTNSLKSVYICNAGKAGGYSDLFIIDSFHHEFSSILLRNYTFPNQKWLACNLKGFSYNPSDHGGRKAIEEGTASLEGSDRLYRKGFLSQYSMSELEEDFNVYSGLIFTDPEKFKDLLNKYGAIGKKFEIWLSFYASIDKCFTRQYFLGSKHDNADLIELRQPHD